MPTLPILQTCFSRSWGGLEIQALEVTDALRRRGHQVILACPDGSRLSDEAAARGIRLELFPVTGYLHPLLMMRLARFLRREGIRLVHSHLSKDLSFVVPAADLAGTHPAIFLSKRVGSYIMKKDPLHRYTYSRVDRVLAVSEVIHRNVLATTPVPPERVLTLHDAIDTTEYSPGQGTREITRAEFGFDAKDVVVGCIGRFSPGKGHEELLHAASALFTVVPPIRFLVVGEASAGEEAYAATIVRLAERLGVGSRVTFAGFRRDVVRILSSIDIFAFPSHAEAFGVVLIEAMAMERPVVASQCDGILDIVVDGNSGIFISPGNAGELAEAIRRLANDAELRSRIGRAGRERVLELFDRQRQMEKLEGMYRQVLEEGEIRNEGNGTR
jgi:glycosyltransferase involved in cell wall biosynthesis